MGVLDSTSSVVALLRRLAAELIVEVEPRELAFR